MSPTAKLTVQISGPKVIVHILIVNSSGDAALYVEKDKVVATPPIRAKLFRVTSEGKEIAYIGPMAKKKPPTREDFFRVVPGGEIKGYADITDLYAFLPGPHEYTIEYRAFHGDPDDESKLTEIKSDPVVFQLSK